MQPPQTPPTSADSAKLDHHTGAGQRLQLVIALGLGDSQPLFEQKPIAILTGAIDQYSKLIPVFSLLIVQFAPVSANTVGFGKSCGGIGGIKCDAGLWCDPRPGQCGQTDLKGRCVKVPTVCPMWSGRSAGATTKPIRTTANASWHKRKRRIRESARGIPNISDAHSKRA